MPGLVQGSRPCGEPYGQRQTPKVVAESVEETDTTTGWSLVFGFSRIVALIPTIKRTECNI